MAFLQHVNSRVENISCYLTFPLPIFLMINTNVLLEFFQQGFHQI